MNKLKATKDDVKAVLGRVLTWPAEAQREAVATLRAIEEEWVSGGDITDEEWEVIEARAKRRDLASDEEVEQVFARYRCA
jgi:hypothetical protein